MFASRPSTSGVIVQEAKQSCRVREQGHQLRGVARRLRPRQSSERSTVPAGVTVSEETGLPRARGVEAKPEEASREEKGRCRQTGTELWGTQKS